MLAAFVHARLLAGGMTEPAAAEFMTHRFTRFLQVAWAPCSLQLMPPLTAWTKRIPWSQDLAAAGWRTDRVLLCPGPWRSTRLMDGNAASRSPSRTHRKSKHDDDAFAGFRL